MNELLNKRLFRSTFKVKIRVFVVLILIFASAFVGTTMLEFSKNADDIYPALYEETNLADLMIDTGEWTHNVSSFSNICNNIQTEYENTDFSVIDCESRLMLKGKFQKSDGEWIGAIFYGFEENPSTSLLFPSNNFDTDVVILDRHMEDQLNLEIGNSVTFSVLGNVHNLSISSFSNSPHHIVYVDPSQSGLSFPQDGTLAIFYFDIDTLTSLSGIDSDARNQVYLNLEGTPAYNLQDTDENEGTGLMPIKNSLSLQLNSNNITPAQIHDRGSFFSVELLRLDLEGTHKVLPIMIILLSSISGLVLAVSMDRFIKTQEREIGVLRTLGFRGVEIRNNYALLPIFLGIFGSTSGVLLGMLGSEYMTNFYFEVWGLPFEFITKNHFPILLFEVWFAVLLIVFLSSLYPIIQGCRKMPLDVMFRRGSSKVNKTLVKLTKNLPTVLGLGIRSTFRKPQRLTITILALGLSIIITGGWMMMFTSMTTFYNDGLSEGENWDARAAFYPTQKEEIDAWLDVSNVTHEYAIIFEVKPEGEDNSMRLWILTESLNENATEPMHNFRLSEGRLPLTNQLIPEVIIDSGTAALLDWSVGETRNVVIAGQTIPIKISGISVELDRTIWVNYADIAELIGGEYYNTIFLKGERSEIESLEDLVLITYSDDYASQFNQALDQYKISIYIFLSIGAIIAIAVLLNTLIINLTEKDSEISTLRILGISKFNLTKILLVENFVIGILGGVVGVFLSIYTAKLLHGSFTTWLFYYEFKTDWQISLMILILILSTSLLTSFYGTRRISNIDLVEKTKVFSSD